MRLFFLGLMIFGVACKKPVPPPPPPPPPPPVVEPAPIQTVEEAVEVLIRNFERVHFDFDTTSLTGASKDALGANATILQDFPNIRVEIQGHADERGTTDYNLALGEKRARVIFDQIVRMGVSESRLRVVSFGEEQPVASGGDEVAWSQNRRAEFRLLSVEQGVEGSVP